MRSGLLAICLVLAACTRQADRPADTVPTAAKATAAAAAPPGEIVMGSIGELSRPDNMDAKLRGARVADPTQFPASLYSRSGGEMCTSTLVGPRAVLTAAHCVKTGAVATFTVGGKAYRAVCERAKQYPADLSADYALCAVQEKDVAGIPWERVNLDPTRIKVGQTPLMTGFGCTAADGTGGNDGVYMIGDESQITVLPSAQSNNIEIQGEVA
ncbi:MAG TPA: trypsin-like serine protease, partial [Phenylobacterium sp.]